MSLDAEQIENWQHGTQVSGDRRGPWSQTASGRKFHPQNPDPDLITAGDIAHHLSMVNRFGGATKWPYSVAQHTLLVAEIVNRCFAPRKALRQWALLHDASEYVLGDVVRPVKIMLPEYAVFEARLTDAIADRFKLPILSRYAQADLKYADNLACVIEKTHLLPHALEWHDMPTYVPGYEDFVIERGWRSVRDELRIALEREFPHA